MSTIIKRKQGLGLGTKIGTSLVVFGLFVLFVVAVAWFRKPAQEEKDPVKSIAEIMTPDPINQAILSGAIDTTSENASIHLLGSQEVRGSVKRGKKDDAYYLEAKMTLPEIDRELYYYMLWIVRPIPYDFLSLGEMTTDEEGNFLLTWQAQDKTEDYFDYDQLVITRQRYQETTDPETKVAEGEFGK